MVRIVAGVAGGRRLAVPPCGTRPTSDRVREAVFSAVQARRDLDGARVLDRYAGAPGCSPTLAPLVSPFCPFSLADFDTVSIVEFRRQG